VLNNFSVKNSTAKGILSKDIRNRKLNENLAVPGNSAIKLYILLGFQIVGYSAPGLSCTGGLSQKFFEEITVSEISIFLFVFVECDIKITFLQKI